MAFTPTGLGVYSGGDDTALRYVATPPRSTASPSALAPKPGFPEPPPVFTWADKRIHSAGVTAILPLSDQIIVTGSYDDHVRVVSVPAQGRRQILAALNLDGGVWRLKLIKQRTDGWQEKGQGLASFLILACCMHAGARVIKVHLSEDDGWSITVLGKFEEHKSMNYGNDFQPVQCQGNRTIVSTSFYDKLLCIWHFSDELFE